MRPDSPRRTVVGVLLAVTVLGLLVAGAAPAQSQQANEPPTAVLTYSPSEPAPREPVSLNATGSSDPDGQIVQFRWDFDGDNQTDQTGGANRRLAFPSAGTYTVGVTVVDNDGATDTATVEIRVVGTEPPVAELTASPRELTVGEPTTLDPTGSTDPDGQIVEWAYDLNGNGTFDRTFDAPTTFRTNYQEPGIYDVTLRVTDNDNMTATATVTIVVEEATPATPTVTDSPTRTGPTTAPRPGVTDTPAPGGELLPDSLVPTRVALAVGGLLLLLLIGLGAGLLWRGRSRSVAGRPIGATLGRLVLALLVTLVLAGAPAYAISQRVVRTVPSTDIAVGVLQLAAFALPTVMLLVGGLLRFADRRDTGPGVGPAVGPLSADQFRWIAFAFGFLATVLLILGLSTLLLAVGLSFWLTVAAGLLLGALGVLALSLAFVLVTLALG